MARTLLSAVLLLFACIALTLGAERLVANYAERARLEQYARQLLPLAERLQGRIDAFTNLSQELASQVGADLDATDEQLQVLVRHAGEREPRVRSVVISRKLKAVAVYPVRGNEPVIGLDFGLYPQFMGSIDRAVQRDVTVVDGPHRLVQSGRAGVIVRTPVFSPTGEFSLLVSIAIDLEQLLLDAGLLDPSLGFTPLLVQQTPGQDNRVVFGDQATSLAGQSGARVTLPDGQWVLYASPKTMLDQSNAYASWVRSVGALVSLILLVALLWQAGVLGGSEKSQGRGGISIRIMMVVAVLLPATLLAAVAGWFSYYSSTQGAKRVEQQQAHELARQIRDQVSGFFEVPRKVDTFIAELMRQGLLDPDRPDETVVAFLAQMRQQPFLTFLSFGNTRGEFMAAGRPPLCDDKTLHVLRASLADDRILKAYRVDVNNQPSSRVSVGTQVYDARNRHWYQAALKADRMVWYDVYHYEAGRTDECFDALGMGMAAPVHVPGRGLVGVVTADVSLSLLGEFLRAQTRNLGASAFIARADGTLLASSANELVYRLNGDEIIWTLAEQSANPVTRVAGATIRQTDSVAGSRFVSVEGRSTLVNWWSLDLPDGPSLSLVITVPSSRALESSATAVRDAIYLSLVVVGIGLVIALFLTYWLTQPLRVLNRWAQQLGSDQWVASPSIRSPIREIVGLAASLDSMAQRQHRHAEELEQKVVERTESLAKANKKLAELSMTDGLTGIANRRQFDLTAAAEYSRATRTGQPLALLLLDVDHFKAYNDECGHLAGDEALKLIAQVIARYARRPGDLAARYGGEEFVVILANTPVQAAMDIAEQIRQQVQALGLEHKGSPCGVITASIGVALLGEKAAASLTELIGMADNALYMAKNAGRNCVRTASW